MIIQFDDRLLTHLQIVIIQKLRRGESFLMSWKDSSDVGGGRSAIWLHPVQALYFKFFGSRVATINPQWLETLTASANGSRGLIVTEEFDKSNGQAPPVAQAKSVRRTDGPSFTKADDK
ncbi:MAG: ATP-dependent DNA ligase [Microbacteriaceae bacterium]